MTYPKISIVGLGVLLLATCGWGMERKPVAAAAAPAAAGAKVELVLTHIPADALGFVIVGNAGDMCRKTDKFLADLGVDQFLARPSPEDPAKTIKTPVLDVLKGLAQLGPGFNPNGGVAAIMLDPKAYGVNVLELMKGGAQPAADATTSPAAGAAPKAAPKIPLVLFVPGTGVKEVFGAYEMSPSGKFTLIKLRMGPTYAAQLGGYVALSPNEKALEAVVSAEKMADKALSPEMAIVVAKGDIAYYINMKLAQPIMTDILKQVQEQATADAGPAAPLVGFYMDFYRQMLGQLDSIAVAGRFGATGLVFEEMVSFLPDSNYGKAMLANKGAGKAQLTNLPNLPYVLAAGGGAAGGVAADRAKFATDMIEGLLKMAPLTTLADADKQGLLKLVRDMTDEITGSEMVLGGAPAGKGLFGADFVIHCKDAEKMKGLLAEQAKLAESILHQVGKDNEDVQKLTIRYVPKMETIGTVSADAIVIDSPKLGDMKEDERAKMKKVLGEDKVRFLIASPDKQTVIVTFGGTADFMAEALKVTGGKGTIGTDPEAAEAIKVLPPNCNGLVLINAGNLFDLIMAGAKTMAPDEELPPFKLACKTPISMGSGVTGSSAHIVVYVPTQLLKEIAQTVMMFAGGGAPGMAPPAGKPAVGGKDF